MTRSNITATSPRRFRSAATSAAVCLALALAAAACASDDAEDAAPETTEAQETATTAAPLSEPSMSVRDSGMVVTVQPAGDLTVHTLTAPEAVFANSTHIIETDNALVLVDTQFLLPNALDVRSYADDIGKPIERVFVTHQHPDHFLGSEAFNDLDVYALADTSAQIADVGDAEVEEKQADFGDAIAGTYVVPEIVEPGLLEIDGVTFELTRVLDAEADVQLVIRIPDAGVVVTGDVVYSGVHLIMAGTPETWTVALNDLAADSAEYPIVLPGHGLPTDPSVYDTNIAWLATFSELLGTAETAEDFKQGLIDAYPELGMDAAIDFVLPFLFPEDAAGDTEEASVSVRDSGMTVTVQPAGDVTVHSLTAPEEAFANSTHIIETDNALVVVDTQFLLPNALDMRAYADELGKPIDRVFITHEHPDHFLGSEAFNDVPVYALAEVAATIAEVGDAEVEEKQADFGDAIAGTYVVPETVEPGLLEVDGVTFELTEVRNAEAEDQLVIRVLDQGVVVTGDIIYSGVHLILAGPADTWITAVNELAADSADYPIVLAGHGVPAGPEVYDTNIAYLNTVLELLGTVDNADDFKQGLLDTFPDLTMEAAIDFGAPFLFPTE